MKKVLYVGTELTRIWGVAFKLFLIAVILRLACTFFGVKLFDQLLSHNWFKMAWNLVGVALIGLFPLFGWMLILVVKHTAQTKPIHKKELLDYEYISTSAPTWGLLGTIIALVMAGAVMAERLAAGSSSDTILGIIPLVSQALFSTVVGLFIQWIADTALHLIERKQI